MFRWRRWVVEEGMRWEKEMEMEEMGSRGGDGRRR